MDTWLTVCRDDDLPQVRCDWSEPFLGAPSLVSFFPMYAVVGQNLTLVQSLVCSLIQARCDWSDIPFLRLHWSVFSPVTWNWSEPSFVAVTDQFLQVRFVWSEP
jgi:hypothetical protein